MAYFTHTVCGRGGVQDGLLLAHALFGVCAGGVQDSLLLIHALISVCAGGGVQDGLLLAHALFGVCAGGGAQDGLLLAHALFGEGRAHICASLPCALIDFGIQMEASTDSRSL